MKAITFVNGLIVENSSQIFNVFLRLMAKEMMPQASHSFTYHKAPSPEM